MKDKLNIIYAGTPSFAVPSLEVLVKADFFVSHVLTQPDKRAGRGMKIIQSPVKQKALELNIPVLQPESLMDDLIYEKIKKINPDIFVVAAYGLIIPQKILDLFRCDALNIHASLLPRWRGAAPIHRAIQWGDNEIGITIMKIIKQLDAGPMIRKSSIRNDNLTTGAATAMLAKLGANLMKEVIRDLENKKPLIYEEQDESFATYAEKITKQEARLNLDDSAQQVIQKINAFNPFPGVYSYFRGKLFKIWRAKKVSIKDQKNKFGYLFVDDKKLYLGLKNETIEIEEIQIEGKSKMTAIEFIDGYKIVQQELILNE